MAIQFLNAINVDSGVLYTDVANGNVGIGTTSPLNKLQVTGGSVGIDSQYMIRDNRNNTILLQSASTAASNRSLTIGNATYSNIIVANGNVGIGTTSPRTKLHVTGLTGDDDPSLGNSTAPLLVSNTANSYGLNVGVNNAGDAWLQAQSNTSATAYNLLLNPLGGNVGIGTTSPSQKLHVVGNARVTGAYYDSSTSTGNPGATGQVLSSTVTGTAWVTPSSGGTGTVTSVTAGTGMTQTGTSTVNPTLNVIGGNGIISNANNIALTTLTTAWNAGTQTITASNFILSSDERLKENIKDLEVKSIDTNWKSFNIKDSDEGYRVGVIAQELEVNNPEFVETDINGYKSVKYIDLLISKIAELEDRIKQLEK